MYIGICGYAESGKDVVADILVSDFGYKKIGMSDALDKYLLILDPIIEAGSNGEEFRYSEIRGDTDFVSCKKLYPEVRRLLQVLGTEVGRAIDPDIWVKEWIDAAEYYHDVVVTGIRFQNEVDMVDKLIWVNRPGIGPKNDHVSENLSAIFEQADHMISNSGTLENLRDMVCSRHEWFTKSER